MLELDDDDRKETTYATRTVYLSWKHLPLDEVTADYQAYQPFKSSDLLPIYYS